MIIVSQNKKAVVNLDNVEYIRVLNRCIRCDFAGSFVLLGSYDTEERAQEVFDYLINRLGVDHYFTQLPEV